MILKRAGLIFLLTSAFAVGQPIPGRYIVEFDSAPAVAVSAAARTRFRAADQTVADRKVQIRTEQDVAETSIRALGGRVRQRFDTLINGMAVDLTEQGAARLRQMPGVRGVYPDEEQHMHLDHAINVHKVPDAWKAITGGQLGAGAGIKIGILDTGIDTTHPAFQGFGTALPAGFPKASNDVEMTHTNNKVIVSRDYTQSGGLDTDGHGTGNAAVAAGLPFDPKAYGIGPFSGFAPGAWLGNYRVFGDNGGSSTSVVMQAMQDAVNDGMNILNYSGGSGVRNASDETGLYARVIDAAVAAGTLVVVSAGNAGPDAGSVGTPAVVASAIAVGSNFNERTFFYYVAGGYPYNVVVGDLTPVVAVPGSSSSGLTSQVSGPMLDVSTIAPDGLACAALPADSLKGQIALVIRGDCNFDDKINNAQNAGALGVVVYDRVAGDPFTMSLPTATLPAVFVTLDAGNQMKQKLTTSPGAKAVLDFSGNTPVIIPSDYVSFVSARGPTPRGGIKPDLLAVGEDVATACAGSTGVCDAGNPLFQVTAGTSLAAPMVTGALAALMSARPGLSPAQYRSLLIDTPSQFTSPTGKAANPQTAGGGKLNLLQALQNNLTADPPSVNFFTASGTVDVSRNVVLTNIGSATDTFTVVPKAMNSSGPVPVVNTASFTLAPGSPATMAVRMTATNPDAGSYQGYLEITGSKGGVVTRIPYWFGVPGATVSGFAFLSEYDFIGASPGDVMTIRFRTTDLNGLPIAAGDPTVTTASPRARVGLVTPDGDLPGTYRVDVTIGRADTSDACADTAPSPCNQFTFAVGDASRKLTFYIQ